MSTNTNQNPKILCVVERAGAGLDDTAWELLGAARALAGEGGSVGAALLGEGVGELANELARGYDDVWVFDDARFASWDGEAYARALAPLAQREQPALILAAHTNLGIDFAPGFSVRAGVPLLPDCLSLESAGDGSAWEAVRTVYGGKVHARMTCTPSEQGAMATLRAGAFAAAEPGAEATGRVHAEDVGDDVGQGRRPVRTVEPEASEVDITQAAVLVAVGRGIEDEENLEIVQSLAEALGGEVACSRPVVDKGWLPKSRQVGTSGLTVKPKVYLAVGISGSFQHVGGIKGSPFLVAINKDARAPIFGVADVGVVGDLFDVVPALEAKIREAKG